jgi:endoglycosylceramidase
MTEIDPAGNSLTAIADIEQADNQAKIGWMDWAFTGYDDITTTDKAGESLVFDPHDPPTGSNVNTADLDTLAQPYPQVVAGTPNSWSFDAGTDTLNFSYSTEMADNSGSFSPGSTTTISVPHVEYPNGYQVSITGGHVASVPDAPELIIASNPGANTVTVTVTAAGADDGSVAAQ